MELKITKGKAEFLNTTKHPQSAINQKDLCFVEFPNCISTTTGRPFRWIPTYKQLAEIFIVLNEIEQQWKKEK